MAANTITIAGATYSDVPSIVCPKSGGGTASYVDVTDTTATASDVASGKYFYTAAGVKTAGTGTGGGGGVTITDTTDSHGGTIREITAEVFEKDTLSVTINGTYTAPSGTLYDEVVVAVPTGSSKNMQIVQGTTRANQSTLTAIGDSLTVSKTGTYDVYWSAARSNTTASYTWGSQLYIDGTAYGSENTSWSNSVQNNHLTGVSLTANQTIRVYGRNTRGTSYYIYAPTLVIVES